MMGKSEKDKMDAIRDKVQHLITIVNELEQDFPERHFTLDGHLVGSIGEVLAKYHYGIDLAKESNKLFDGKTPDGREVQIKITQQDYIVISGKPECLLVMYLTHSGEVYEVFNGPGDIAWKCASKNPDSHNNYHMSVNKLMKLDAEVALNERIAMVEGRDIEKMRKEYKNKK
ncbi:MAG: hypothetical protein IKX20_03140 [Paludibacteraceae bacterium]|nr:hypothetical protein [Paludibacteraceae bacterium]